MSKKLVPLSLERITVAFAASESSPHSLETIAKLVAGYKADVAGVFIEDVDMLHASQLPFALEVCRATNVVRRVNAGEIERGLKKRAAAARDMIVRTAERTGAKWSFEVVRQRTSSAVLELAKATDVIVFAAATSLRYRNDRAARITTVNEHHPSIGEPVVVLVDRSAASGRAIQVAHKLAEMRHTPVYAVAVAASKAGVDRLSAQLLSSGGLDTSHVQGLCRPQFSEVVEAAQVWRPAAVVLPIALIEGSSERIHLLQEAIENPILIVK